MIGGAFSDLAPLARLPHLARLHLSSLPKLRALDPIGQMSALEVLLLQALNEVRALPDMTKLRRLRAVRLASMKKLRDFSALARAPALEEVVLQNAEHQKPDDLAPVLAAKKLVRAGFGFWKRADVARMTALADARNIDVEVFRYPQLRGDFDLDDED